MTRFADERPLLATLAQQLSRAGALVSFNGKSFDAPLLETRYLFHRLDWFGGEVPHVDVLHPARLFWRGRPLTTGSLAKGALSRALADFNRPSECSLVALERQLLGYRRAGDVAGFDIPSRYFQFLRTGHAGPLAAVLEHNRLDLVALAALTARLFGLARTGPEATRDPREALALGRVYARAGLEDRARAALERALALSRAPAGAHDPVTIETLRALAHAYRRAREFDAAARCWQRLLETRGCPEPIAREASQALAIHNEHRRRDLLTARSFALKNLEHAERGMRPAWTQAVQHRLSRLDRKLEREGRRPDGSRLF
jgi:tetratricopeptide (TPR) repeat protein